MWVSSIVINNVKSFADSGVINLDKRMNILIGPNNAGKSVIIKGLYLLQNATAQNLNGGDIRKGAQEGKIIIELEDIDEERYMPAYQQQNGFLPKVHFTLTAGGITHMVVFNANGGSASVNTLPQTEPINYIYPFLAKRKVVS